MTIISRQFARRTQRRSPAFSPRAVSRWATRLLRSSISPKVSVRFWNSSATVSLRSMKERSNRAVRFMLMNSERGDPGEQGERAQRQEARLEVSRPLYHLADERRRGEDHDDAQQIHQSNGGACARRIKRHRAIEHGGEGDAAAETQKQHGSSRFSQ